MPRRSIEPTPIPAASVAPTLYVIGVLKIKLYCYQGGEGVPDPARSIINSFAVVFIVITLLAQKWLLFILFTCVCVLFYLFLSPIRLFFGGNVFLCKNGGWCVYLDGGWLMFNMRLCVGVEWMLWRTGIHDYHSLYNMLFTNEEGR